MTGRLQPLPDEVWLVDFGEPFPGEPARHRPAVVLGPRQLWGDGFPVVFVVPTTSVGRGLAGLHVEVEPDGGNGLEEVTYVQCEMVRSVSKRRLVHRLGIVDGATSHSIAWTVRGLLGY